MNPETARSIKKRTITLTNRAPVIILEAEWPIVAMARGASGDAAEYTLRVRRHADGRAIVYGVVDARTEGGSWRGGEVVDAAGDAGAIAAGLRRVGKDAGIPERIIASCIADLPATPL